MSSLSATDIKILATLQKEGDISNVELSERIGMSPSPCLRKVKSLRETGYITDIVALLDHKKLGFKVVAFVEVKVPQVADAEIVREFQNAVNNEPAIVECYITSGPFDFMLKVVAHDIEEYADLLTERLLRMPGVQDTRSTFVLKNMKRSTALPI